jgi:hypothetical protein
MGPVLGGPDERLHTKIIRNRAFVGGDKSSKRSCREFGWQGFNSKGRASFFSVLKVRAASFFVAAKPQMAHTLLDQTALIIAVQSGLRARHVQSFPHSVLCFEPINLGRSVGTATLFPQLVGNLRSVLMYLRFVLNPLIIGHS